MNPIRVLLLSWLLTCAIASTAHQVTDTLYSPHGDRVIVTYDLVQKNNQVTIKFKEVRKKLGAANKSICDDLAEVKVMFFDRIGFSDVTFKGMAPSILMIPPEINYTPSADGFIDLDESPTVAFENKSDVASVELNIPVFLVHYEKKYRYKIFAQCNNLVIKSKRTTAPQQEVEDNTNTSAPSLVQLMQEETLTDDDNEALVTLQYIAEELSSTEKLPFSDMLLQKTEHLKLLKFKIQKSEIVSKIDQILKDFESKKALLEAKAAEEAKRTQEAENRKMDSTAFAQCSTIAEYEAYLKAYPDGAYYTEAQKQKAQLTEEANAQTAKEKRRKIWLIVGGILLGILLFVGNQVMQSFRNMKMQRNMMKMQQNAATQAQNMAKRKVQGEIRKQTSKATGQIKKKSKEIVRQGSEKIKQGKPDGGNNRVSI